VKGLPRSKDMPCSCSNEYQDQKYGKGRRLHNQSFHSKTNKPKGWRCTVCGHHKVDV
jgi:hypothetical protein